VKRVVAATGAVVCLVLAVLVTVLAVDVLRWRNTLSADDVRYRVAPAASGLWRPSVVDPFGIARHMLGVGDDVAFREAVRSLRLSKLSDASNSDTKLILQRADAEDRLQDVATGNGGAARRSRAFGLLGVLKLSTPAANRQERAANLKAAGADLQQAIALDPSNDDAKYNLEVALRRSKGVQTAQGGPSPNSRSNRGNSKGAATGPPTSGY
jgi:hypothetical protein